ncbi:MFS transporter [Micromonospora thermarum]|uniref:MFS transporter n=1 Tax=Micromonospora thermarum TaxID=2720024 RepID=UPI0028161646|nr:MFS transporter [Micromonospora thermarum]
MRGDGGARRRALLIPLWILGGAANGGDNVFANVLTARRVPESSRARAYAVNGAAIQGGSMAGYLIGGALLAVVPPRPLIAGLGLVGLLVVASFVPVVARAVRRDRAGASPAPAGEPDERPAPVPVVEEGAAPVAGAGGSAAPTAGPDDSAARRPVAAVLATPTPPGAPVQVVGDTVR